MRLVCLEYLARMVYLDHLEKGVRLVNMDHLDLQESLEWQDQQDPLENQVRVIFICYSCCTCILDVEHKYCSL